MNYIGDDIVGQKVAVSKSYDRFQFNRTTDWGLYGHDIGIHPLNMMIGGVIPSKITTIAARSGHGKTAMTTQMFDAGRRVLRGRRVNYIFFTWEMESSYLVDRHICRETGLTNRMLSQGAKLLPEQYLDDIMKAYKDSAELKVVYQQYATNISKMREIFLKFCEYTAEQSVAEGIDIIPAAVVDYIGMAQGEGKNSLKTYDIADFVNGCKKIANETNGSIILIAQLNRGADHKELPQRNDLADSAAIENASDNLILLHRPEYVGATDITDPDTGIEIPAKHKMLIRVLKSRDYGTGDRLINCDIAYNRFYDLGHTWNFPYWDMYKDKAFWMYELGMSEKKPDYNNDKIPF
jgi:replicative DNA helicase